MSKNQSLINRAIKILEDIDHEAVPLRNCLHYRAAADILSEMVAALEVYE